MASKKQHAAVDFQGAANITIGGSAGSSGQVLTTGGSGAMSWSAKTSGGVTKVTFHLKWKTSGTSFASSSRGDGASGKLSFESGLDWTDYKITFQHDLNTEYLVSSVMDVNAQVVGADEYVDMNFDDDAVAKKISDDKTQLIFNTNNSISANANFRVTFIG
jgi:hypothetical protein